MSLTPPTKAILISVKDIIGGNLALEVADGECVQARIREVLDRGESVTVSLLGLQHVITLFIESAIGRLYAIYPPDVVDSKVVVVALDAANAKWIKIMRKRARDYYNNPELRKALDETSEEMYNNW